MAKPPVARVDDQVTDSPGLIVDEITCDVTDFALGRVNVRAGNGFAASSAGGPSCPLPAQAVHALTRIARSHRIRLAPHARVALVAWIAVMGDVLLLVLPGHRLLGVDGRASPDLRTS